MKDKNVWFLLRIFAVLTILSYLYFEMVLVIQLFIKPLLEASGDLKYQESLGLFAPAIYMFEGGIKILESFSPILKYIQTILLVINSILLIASIITTKYIFKNVIWAGVMVVLLSILSIAIWFL